MNPSVIDTDAPTQETAMKLLQRVEFWIRRQLTFRRFRRLFRMWRRDRYRFERTYRDMDREMQTRFWVSLVDESANHRKHGRDERKVMARLAKRLSERPEREALDRKRLVEEL